MVMPIAKLAVAFAPAEGRRWASAQPVDDPLETDRFTRWEAAGEGAGGGEAAAERARIGSSSLQLSGLHCAACALTIEATLYTLPGVLQASVNAVNQRASVRWDAARTAPSAWIDAIQRAGYGAAPDIAASARALRRAEQRSLLWRLFVAGFCAMQIMMLATPAYVAPPGDLAPDLASLLGWGSWVLSLPVMGFAGLPFLRAAWRGLRNGQIGMDLPVALGIVVMFLASTVALFDPGGPLGQETYFDSLTMFIAFLWLGRWLEMGVRHRAAQALEDSFGELPATALRLDAQGRPEPVSVLRLRPGDIVRVPRGAAIPADGTLLTAAANVGEALLTGESRGLPKHAGDSLLAGSLNLQAPLEMRVSRVGSDTRFESIVALMRDAASQRPAVAGLADRWAAPFLWAVLLLAAAATAAWSVIDPARAVAVGVAVLIVTCPCALWLATPATLVAAASGLASRGVLLRRVGALEALAQVDTVFIDKTGTLSEDRPLLSVTLMHRAVPPVADVAQALQSAASLARWSSHPLCASIVEAAGEFDDRAGWHDITETPGAGLAARDAHGRCWRLGSAAWAGGTGSASGAAGDDTDGELGVDRDGDDGNEGGAHRVWLRCDNTVVASFEFTERLRAGAAQAVAALHAEGLSVTLLSGDDEARTQAFAAAAGINTAVGAASPEHKLALVQAAQRAGSGVLMVGDGLNDAPVLAAANVSIAMGQGALASRSVADAVIVSGQPAAIVDARCVARRTMQIVRQNLAWAAAYNGACIPLALAGAMPPWAAGLGMAASSLLVMLNAQRAARAPR